MFCERNDGWAVVAKYGRRCRYEINAMAWKFSGTLVALISPDNDDYVDCAMKVFEATGGPQTLQKVLRYMTLLADLRSPISSACGLVSIPVIGLSRAKFNAAASVITSCGPNAAASVITSHSQPSFLTKCTWPCQRRGVSC